MSEEATVQQEELAGDTTAEEYTEAAGAEGEVDAEAQDTFAVFGGEEVKVAPKQKDAHTAVIQSVSENVSDRGSHSIRVVFLSNDTGNEITWDIWVPLTFAEATGQFLTRKLGVENLPPGEPDPEKPGKLKGNQRASYGMSIKNSAGDASVQQLLNTAAQSGIGPGPLAKAFNENTTFEEYTAALNEVLSGLEVVLTRVPDKPSDEYPRGFLKVNRIYHPSIKDDPKGMKALRLYVRHWEIGQ